MHCSGDRFLERVIILQLKLGVRQSGGTFGGRLVTFFVADSKSVGESNHIATQS